MRHRRRTMNEQQPISASLVSLFRGEHVSGPQNTSALVGAIEKKSDPPAVVAPANVDVLQCHSS